MNDEQVVQRLRSALDEVANTAVPVPGERTVRGGLPAMRWVAIAASGVLVVGAAVAVAVNWRHSNTTNSGSSDAPGLTTTIAPPPTFPPTTAPNDLAMPYFLATADLAPGERSFGKPCCDQMVLAWARNGDPAQGFLVAAQDMSDSPQPPNTTPTATIVAIGDATLVVDSFGLTVEERDALAAQIVPGSGLPWVLPVDEWQFLAMSGPGTVEWTGQSFGAGEVMIKAGVGADVFFTLAAAPTVRTVTVAGLPGWAFDYTDGYTVVLWQHPESGRWVTMEIGIDLADRVDALIAAVVPAG